ncbi:MAG TPA: LCP family protein [Acidimicrobiia bacterium]|nr:LCP family protein [Acidimicrobiia bacterium]
MKQLSPRMFLHRLITAFVVAALLMTIAIAGAYAEAARKVSKVSKVAMDTSVLEPGDNYLLIGSDSRAFVDTPQQAQHFGSAQEETGQRSDTIMVVHVDSATGTALVVSFPRDLWVAIPGLGHAKINAAFNAGPQRVIETIEQDFDVPISHYLQIDFEGFQKMVNTLGSIPIYFPAPARDAKSGLNVPTAGCVHLSGSQALAYVRSRYYESFVDGRWQSDPTSDLGRIQRQQYFLRTLAQETLKAAERKPWKASDLADSMLADLQRDPKLGLSSLRALAYAFHRPGGVETQTLPATRHFFDGQDALQLDATKAAPMLARLRGIGKPLSGAAAAVAPASVHIAVENGSGRTGLGAGAHDALAHLGFSLVAPATNADRSDYAVTEVRYVPGASAKAQFLLSELGGAGRAVALNGSAPNGADVVLVLGTDYHGLSSVSTTGTPATAASGSTQHAGASGSPAGSSATSGTSLPAIGC